MSANNGTYHTRVLLGWSGGEYVLISSSRLVPKFIMGFELSLPDQISTQVMAALIGVNVNTLRKHIREGIGEDRHG